jgi:hypothetical protein
MQAAWVVLIKPKSWRRHRLKSAKKRLRHNVLANALARIAYSIRWNGSRKFCLT